MENSDNPHQLLPWHATGKLERDEADRFRAHLESCPACREELAFLQSVRAGTDEFGDDFYLQHPSSDRLVDAVLGFLATEEAAGVLRHLEICDLCAAEARWVRGEEPVGGEAPSTVVPFGSPRRRPVVQWGGWVAAAAASVLLAVVVWQRPPELDGRWERKLLVPTERAGAVTTRFTEGDRRPMPEIEVDFPRAAFPVRIEVFREGAVVFSDEAVELEDLSGERYYAYPCLDCPSGEYVIRVTSSDPAEPVLEIVFEVRPESD